MQKKIGAILFVAGTCIGSGMIALPMVLAKLGLVPSLLLMVVTWFVMYYTSLVNIELNLQADEGLSLGELGRRFSGRIAEMVGTICIKLLAYSLLAVFIYGGSSILQELLAARTGAAYSLESISTAGTLLSMFLLALPMRFVDYFNRILFMSLLGITVLLIAGLAASVDWSTLPLFADKYADVGSWIALIPVVFTSFGFQGIFHTLTNYSYKDSKILKTAFLWGSLIPAIVYILWTCSILCAIYHQNPIFYAQMVEGKAQVGELVQVLSRVAKWESVQLLIQGISLLAIATSIIGVGMGLLDTLKEKMGKTIHNSHARSLVGVIMTMLPPYLAVIYIPNAFLTVLGFAGMILAIIAIILPVYLFWQLKGRRLFYQELRHRWLIVLTIIAAVGVIICEIVHMF
jgi:tyrosine-specific transport protein